MFFQTIYNIGYSQWCVMYNMYGLTKWDLKLRWFFTNAWPHSKLLSRSLSLSRWDGIESLSLSRWDGIGCNELSVLHAIWVIYVRGYPNLHLPVQTSVQAIRAGAWAPCSNRWDSGTLLPKQVFGQFEQVLELPVRVGETQMPSHLNNSLHPIGIHLGDFESTLIVLDFESTNKPLRETKLEKYFK
jgi:hypothetical protein